MSGLVSFAVRVSWVLTCFIEARAAYAHGKHSTSRAKSHSMNEWSRKQTLCWCIHASVTCDSRQEWKPLWMDWRGSSTCRSTEKRLHVVLTFEAPKFRRQLWRQNFGASSGAKSFANPQLVRTGWWTYCFSKRCVCVFGVFRVWSAHFMRNVLIHHGPLFNWSYAMRSVHVASNKDQSGYLTDQWLNIWDQSTESSKRSWTLPVDSKASFPFRLRASEMLAKWPIDARTLAHLCSANAKGFASPPLVWTGWQTYEFATRRQSPKKSAVDPLGSVPND